jgi:hypothetical protein
VAARARLSLGGFGEPGFGGVELVGFEDSHLAGEEPAEAVDGVSHPVFVGDDGESAPARSVF